MLVGLLLGVLTGYPLALVVGVIGLVAGYAVFGDSVIALMYQRWFGILNDYTLLAIPLFVFMGLVLERSGISERMFDALYVWLGGFRGGLAITTVLIGTILGACVGVVGASVAMLAIVSLRAMCKRGYDKSLAAGSVCAGGTLGQLIPPSILIIIYGSMAQISVGKLFMGAFIPGFLLSALYCAYIAIRSLLQPALAPTVSQEERNIPFLKKTVDLVVAIVPTFVLILSVLGSIFFGIAPPTEAAAVGAFISMVLAISYRRFNWQTLKEVTLGTLKTASMILLIGGMSYVFTGVFIGGGGSSLVRDFVLSAPGGSWGAFAVIMFIVFVLGFFIDVIGILFIMVPIIAPLASVLGFDPIWFGMMIMVNLQMAFMTPPFAVTIFYLRGMAPPELGITMGDIIRGVIPFVLLIIVGISLLAAFPELVLWLPGKMIK